VSEHPHARLLVYHLTMWIKKPGDDAFVSWHQDLGSHGSVRTEVAET